VQYVIICFCFGLAGGLVGKSKGSSFFLWFLISAVVPFIGLVTAFAYRVERDELRRRCPNCAGALDRNSAMRSFCFEPPCRGTRLTQ